MFILFNIEASDIELNECKTRLTEQLSISALSMKVSSKLLGWIACIEKEQNRRKKGMPTAEEFFRPFGGGDIA
jgi:hypothetical protein